MSEVTKNNLIKGLAYIAGCGAIAYAIKVTKSAKPLWALLLLSAPNFISGGHYNSIVKVATGDTDSESEEKNDEEKCD